MTPRWLKHTTPQMTECEDCGRLYDGINMIATAARSKVYEYTDVRAVNEKGEPYPTPWFHELPSQTAILQTKCPHCGGWNS